MRSGRRELLLSLVLATPALERLKPGCSRATDRAWQEDLAHEVREQVRKIAGSAGFRRSERMVRYLEWCVERTLEGKTGELRETSLGHYVFDRGGTFDPRTDAIVRVEHGRLRRKLSVYYETEGRLDPVVIRFEAGSYVPKFIRPGEDVEITKANRIPTTVAVLPFEDLSPDGAMEMFCGGIVESIIDALSEIDELSVLSRGSTLRLSKVASAPQTVTMVEGSVRTTGDVLRVSARILEAKTGHLLWSMTLDRPIVDPFKIMDEISSAVASTMRSVNLGSCFP